MKPTKTEYPMWWKCVATVATWVMVFATAMFMWWLFVWAIGAEAWLMLRLSVALGVSGGTLFCVALATGLLISIEQDLTHSKGQP